MNKILRLFLLAISLAASINLFGQTNEEYATINIYRLQESMMSGGRGLTIKVLFNDQVISVLQTNTKLIYKLHTTGVVKIKCFAEFGQAAIGSPYTQEMQFEKGKEYHVSISAGSMTGVKVEIPSEKAVAKIQKNKFDDTIEAEEGK